MTNTDKATQSLTEALTEVIRDALTKAGFPPSERLLDRIHEEIRHALTLK